MATRLEINLENNNFIDHVLRQVENREQRVIFLMTTNGSDAALTFTSSIPPKVLKEMLTQFAEKL
jgi:hypothetical protein